MPATLRAGIVALVLTGLLAGAPGASAELSAPEIVTALSKQREANGIPGQLIERSDWSSACARHNYYEAQTGDFGHFENPSSPYYSEEGHWAAQNSVLSAGSSWDAGNPWEDAPIHLIQMLAPALSEMGAAESDGYNCATTWPGFTRPEPDELSAYSYPGDGVSGVVPSEEASEWPFIPGDFVGLPGGTTTGRYLLAYLSGFSRLAIDGEAGEVTASAALAGPAGPVELRIVDSTHPDVGGFMPTPSAFLIPVRPLSPFTSYQAVVHWSVPDMELAEQRFSFTTGADPPAEEVDEDVAVGGRRSSRRGCRRYTRRAHRAHGRAVRLKRRAKHLAGARMNGRARKRIRILRNRSRKARRVARRFERRAKHCRRRAARSLSAS